MTRVTNFNAGPAGLPTEVLARAQGEFLEYQDTGMSIMEHSHRGKAYDEVHKQATSLMRELLSVPDTHDVLFMQGGASLQFAMVPMNLLPPGKSADYVLTGHWSERALDEAKAIGTTNIVGTTQSENYVRIPRKDEIKPNADAAYIHMTSNNTIYGTQWAGDPDLGSAPIVSDMSSDFLSRPMDVSRYGVIYAGAQKNLGPSGVTVVIIRKNLVEAGAKTLPKILQYRTFASSESLYNTPPTLAIYLSKLVLEWIKGQGGLPGMSKRNETKANAVYAAIDDSNGFYTTPVQKDARSKMNVVFRLPSEDAEKKFLSGTEKAGLVGLKGHRNVGGCRASIYNAVAPEGVAKLCQFMADFRKAQ